MYLDILQALRIFLKKNAFRQLDKRILNKTFDFFRSFMSSLHFVPKVACEIVRRSKPSFPDCKMKEYLNSKGHENLHNFAHQEVCSLDILQAMMQACLISPPDLSLLKEMMEFCSRNDLLQRIDEVNHKKVCAFSFLLSKWKSSL